MFAEPLSFTSQIRHIAEAKDAVWLWLQSKSNLKQMSTDFCLQMEKVPPAEVHLCIYVFIFH